ncbi:MAG: L,D-transpeptidase family protein [Phycisphaerales bacterium JB050]
MALPSQSARSRNPSYGPRFTVSRKRPRRGRARLVLAIVILFAGLAAIYLWQWGGEEGPVDAIAGDTSGAEDQTQASSDDPSNRARRALSASNTGGSGNSGGSGPADLVMGQPTGSSGDPAGRSTPSGSGGSDPDPLQRPERPADTGREQTRPTPSPITPRENTAGRDAQVQSLISSGDDLMGQGRVIQARDAYNRALHHPRASAADRAVMRTKLSDIGKEVTFSKRVVSGDEMAYEYAFKSGEYLSTVVRREGLNVEWQLIERVNGISANRIRAGQGIKLLRGPFHAVISKNDYRLDVYSDFRDSGGNRIYVGSYSVGLGEYDSTPVGSWIVEKTKTENPAWVNPRTGERFGRDDPKNPIGERWIPLRGTDPNTEAEQGIGIHGTIEPDSIGKQQSMGCVRLLDNDVEWVFDLLTPLQSTVVIRP